MDNGFRDEIEGLGEEVINEIIEDYFTEIKDELKKSLIESMGEEIKKAARVKISYVVEEYIRMQIEDDNLLCED